jgi:hypothetical protein
MSPHAYLTAPRFAKPKDTRPPEMENRAFITKPDGREICRNHPLSGTSEGRAEYKRRIALMLERQNGICCLAVHLGCCPGPLVLSQATFEHETGRGMGGSRRDDRTELPNGKWINGAACWQGNQKKGGNRLKYND